MIKDSNLTFTDEFMREYYKQLPKSSAIGGSYEHAYKCIEDRYFAVFGRRRYKSYGVFRSALSKWTKINRELGYEPQVKFEDGLRETIQWYRDNEAWWKPLKNR